MSFTPPVAALNRGHATLWGNLGDWHDASEYVDAARALAVRLGDVAKLGPGQRVVDLGAGAGDQLRVWVEDFGVGHVTALELDSVLAARSASRISEWGLDSRVRVIAGEATATDWGEGGVDRVVALDSAYFFGSHERLLHRSCDALRPGGVLALTDLLLGDGISARVARVLAPYFGIRKGDLQTEPRYRAMLARNGFDQIQIHDCTDSVLAGFSEWVRSGGHRRGAAPSLPVRAGLSVTAQVAGRLAGPTGLRYVLATARRTGT